jgi:hypothetical protein
MSEGKALCQICGEPLPPGEEMFTFHGYSGDCPKPPLEKVEAKVVVEYFLVKRCDGFWVAVHVDRQAHDAIGPFDTKEECQRCYDDLLSSMPQTGAVDVTEQ